jgi:hypothetical protein
MIDEPPTFASRLKLSVDRFSDHANMQLAIVKEYTAELERLRVLIDAEPDPARRKAMAGIINRLCNITSDFVDASAGRSTNSDAILERIREGYARIAEIEMVAAAHPGDRFVLASLEGVRHQVEQFEEEWKELCRARQVEVCRYKLAGSDSAQYSAMP